MERRRDWRHRLVEWASSVRLLPYKWGKTDCASLVRSSLFAQFGEDVIPMMSDWTSLRKAIRVWATVGSANGFKELLEQLGGRHIPNRSSGRWPMGTVLILPEHDGTFPAMGVCVEPIVVQSDSEHGVQWCDPTDLAVDTAWLFEHVEPLTHG